MHKHGVFKEKVKSFNNLFQIIPQNQVPELIEEVQGLDFSKIAFYQENNLKSSSLKLWNDLKNSLEEGQSLHCLSKILHFAHTLPTSSSDIEQSFSSLKFIKNVFRSNLLENTTQALLLIAQEYENKDIEISVEMVEGFKKIRKELSQRKSNKKKKIKKKKKKKGELRKMKKAFLHFIKKY